METMNNQKQETMSVIDVLRENVRILNGMRIPVSEREIWNAVAGVCQNTQACIDAMEQAEAKAAEGDNIVEMGGGVNE